MTIDCHVVDDVVDDDVDDHGEHETTLKAATPLILGDDANDSFPITFLARWS